MTRTLIVRGLKLFDAKHALAARCGVRRRSAAHAAKADDDHVETTHVQGRMPSMARLLVLFFASGCAALIYETVWFYLVQLVVGASSISVAVLLCAFMGGMALGSWLLTRLTPRTRSPLRVVAALEIGIAIFGIVIPIALPWIQQVYLTLAEPGSTPVTLRAFVCFLVLTPPTMLMGATLPAIARRYQAREAQSVGMIYMANLAGAATGTVFAGFYLLRVYDTVIATARRGDAERRRRHRAVTCLSHREDRPPTPQAPMAEPDHDVHRMTPIYLAAALSGFTALGAEVVWTRQLSLLFGASVYTFSLILAVFLTGLGIGGYFGSYLARACTLPRGHLASIQALLAGAIGYGALAIVDLLAALAANRAILTGGTIVTRLDVRLRRPPLCFRAHAGDHSLGRQFPVDAGGRTPRRFRESRRPRSTPPTRWERLAGAIPFTLIGIPQLGHMMRSRFSSSARRSTASLLLLTIPNAMRLHATRRHCPHRGDCVVGRAGRSGTADCIRALGELLGFDRAIPLSRGRRHGVGGCDGRQRRRQAVSHRRQGRSVRHGHRHAPRAHVGAHSRAHPSASTIGPHRRRRRRRDRWALSIHPEIERIVICDIEPIVPGVRAVFRQREPPRVRRSPRAVGLRRREALPADDD